MENAAAIDLMALETLRLSLRKLTVSDAPDLFALASDSAVTEYTTWQVHQTIDDSQAFIRSMLQRYERHQVAPWGVVHKRDGRLIGTCGYNTWQPEYARGEIGYALARAYWGQGLATEAVQKVVEFGYETMHLNRIQAVCDVANTASARVLEKVGMTYEGTLREYGFAKERYRNLKMYSILRREWEAAAR